MSRLGYFAALFVTMSATNAWAQAAYDKPRSNPSSNARTNEVKAVALRAEGEEFVKADDCAGALAPLRSAWAMHEDGKTAVLLGECELRLGQEPEAAHHLARAVELLPEGAERTRVESMLQAVSSRVARLDVVVNEPGAVVVVGKFVMDTPIEDLFVAPGDVKVVVKKTGFGEQERTVKALAGQTARVEVTLTRRSNDSDLDHPEKHHDVLPLIPTYVGVAAGLTSIGIGLGSFAVGKAYDELANVLRNQQPNNYACRLDSQREGCSELMIFRVAHDRYVNASTGLFVTGGMLLGGAFVYAMVASQKMPKDLAIIPVVSPSNQGFSLQGRF